MRGLRTLNGECGPAGLSSGRKRRVQTFALALLVQKHSILYQLEMNKIKALPVVAAMIPEAGATREALPLYLSPVVAGFPSPAEDYLDRKLDLHEYLVRNNAATYFVRAAGDSMIRAGIHDGDLLVVDRSLTPGSGSVVIAAVDGELTVKYLTRKGGRVLLVPANEEYLEIDVTEHENTVIWGVVTYAIHKLNPHAMLHQE
jgi:DNA polymerase V